MRIGILGAGISGLALASCLESHGLSACIFERTKELRPLGAGVSIGPQALDTLNPHIRDQIRDKGSPMRNTTIRGITGAVLHSGAWPHRAAPENPTFAVLRSDLQRALLNSLDTTGIQLGMPALDYWSEADSSVTVLFATGLTLNFDILVCADGVWSQVSAKIDGRQHLVSHDSVVVRGLVPASALWDSIGDKTGEACLWVGPNRNFLCYPVDRGNQYYVTAYLSRYYADGTKEFDPSTGYQDATQSFKHDDPVINEVLEATSICEYRPAIYRTKPRHVRKGNLIGLGDAIGAVPSHSAQGATSAIISARWLGDLIGTSTKSAGILNRNLDTYEQRAVSQIEAVHNYGTAVADFYLKSRSRNMNQKVKSLNALIDDHSGHIFKARTEGVVGD